MPDPEQSIDALDLVAQCYAAWHGWLTQEGVLT
jgi:hypothetical protein